MAYMRVSKRITYSFLVLANIFAGMVLGLLWVKWFVPPKEMGWDGIADAISGAMIGALLGAVATIPMAKLLSMRRLQIWIGVAAGFVAILIFNTALTKQGTEQEQRLPTEVTGDADR